MVCLAPASALEPELKIQVYNFHWWISCFFEQCGEFTLTRYMTNAYKAWTVLTIQMFCGIDLGPTQILKKQNCHHGTRDIQTILWWVASGNEHWETNSLT